MPGPSVMVRVLGDLSGLAKSFKDAQSTGSAAAKGMHEAFSGVLGALNKTGILGPFGEALDGIDQALDKVKGHAKDIGPAMMGIGGALAGVGVGLTALGSKDQAAHQQLQAAVEATGRSYDDYEKQVEAAIKHQERFGNTANQTQDALRVLTQATGDPAKALQYLNTASDLAAAKHESLTEAAGQLGKAYNGAGRILKEFGVSSAPKAAQATKGLEAATKQAEGADKALASAKQHLADIEAIDAGKKKLTASEAIALRNAQQKVRDATAVATDAHKKLAGAQDTAKASAAGQSTTMAALAQKLHGQASAAADTFGGKLAAIKAHLEDTAASFGQKYGPAITAAGSGMALLGGAITATQGIIRTFTGVQKTQQAVTEAVTGAEEAQAAASWLSLGPILLIIAAVAALVAIGYVIYRNWTTIWGAIKDAVKAVWDWIKANWPLLLGILLGPIALAAALIWKYWKYIWDGILMVWHWIQANWPLLLAILTGPIGLAVLFIVRNWNSIINVFAGVLNWIAKTWSTVTGYITAPIQAAWNWISQTIGTVVGWFTGMPAQIGAVLLGVIDFIISPFKAAFNAVADVWNSTVGSLSFHIPSWVPGVGGKGFDMPKIPHLAQGGLITASGIVFAHAGEVISPAPPTRAGPAVVIQEANFATELDADAFMRRVAWVVRTQRI